MAWAPGARSSGRKKAGAEVQVRACRCVSELAREVHAQATLEYALTVLALLAMVVVLALIWRAGEEDIFVHLVEEAASHALSAWGAFDIALY